LLITGRFLFRQLGVITMFFDPILLVVYVVISAIVGVFGRKRSVGCSGIFTFSLLVSPIVMALVLIVSAPRTVEHG
jgi:hypothetical protein